MRYQSGECGVSGEMLLDGLNVCSQIEQPPHPCDDGRQYLEVWKQYPDFKALLLREVSYGNASQRPVDFDGSQITSSLNKFDTRLFRLAENAVEGGKWTNPSERLMPGEGAIFFNPTSDYKSFSFVGSVMQGNPSIPIPSGFSIRSSLLPQAGNLEDLGFPIAEGDVIHLFDRDRQKYVLYPYEGGKWTEGPPLVSVGESFWVAKTEPGNWTRSFGASS